MTIVRTQASATVAAYTLCWSHDAGWLTEKCSRQLMFSHVLAEWPRPSIDQSGPLGSGRSARAAGDQRTDRAVGAETRGQTELPELRPEGGPSCRR